MKKAQQPDVRPFSYDEAATSTAGETLKRLGIDKEECFFQNHQALDQTMDLRNDTMKIVYPFGAVKTKEEFPAALEKHMESAAGHKPSRGAP